MKAAARRSYKSMADSTWTHTRVQPYVKKQFFSQLRKEIKHLCSFSVNSMMLQSGYKSFESFSWRKVEKELRCNSPLFYDVLMQMTKTRRPRSNHTIILCVCAAIILKFRYPKMSLIQKIISCVLYYGHCSKQVNK